MLVTFALETEATAVKADADASVLARHHSFLKLWHDHGIMVQSPEQSGLTATVEEMPLRFRTRWQTALKHNRYSNLWPGVRVFESLAALESIKSSAEVVFVDPVTAVTVFNMAESIPLQNIALGGVTVDSMEICRFDCAAMSSHFAEVEIRGEEMIPGDMSLTEVWKSRFERLAGQSTQIVIVDRYGCEPGPNMDGLRKLFILLDGTARNARISLFVGYGSRRGTTQSPNRSGIDLFQRVSDVVTPLSRGGVGSCCLYCVDDGTFELLSHNRFLRFDDAVCDIDVGVSLFGGIEGRLYRTSAFSMKHQCDDYRKTEEGLRRKADKYSGPIDVLGKRTESLPSVPQHEG